MKRILRIQSLFFAILVMMLMSIPWQAKAAEFDGDVLADLDLTDEQITALSEIVDEFNQTQMDIMAGLETSIAALENEITREGRMASKTAAKKSARNFNKHVKDISDQTGKLLRTRVAYLLKAKNILTPEQRRKILANLDFEIPMPEDMIYFDDLDVLDIGLDLTADQEKKILKYKSEKAIKDVNTELAIEYKMIDLVEELSKDNASSEKIDQLVMDMVASGVALLDNYVDTFLKIKDVFTVEQKRELVQLVMMAQ